MGHSKKAPSEIFSWIVIAVSLASMSGLAIGHATGQSVHPRLSGPPSADPVERFGLGRDAFKMPDIPARVTQGPPLEYADASYDIGRYEKGARVLTPSEPARKRDRLRLERLQAWNDQSFGSDTGPDEEDVDYAGLDDYPPIDVGAVIDAPEATVRPVLVQIAARNSDF